MQPLTARRITLLALLIIPIGLLIISFGKFLDNQVVELAYYIFGVPIFVLNAWEWTEPGLIDQIFGLERVKQKSRKGTRRA